MVLLTILKKLKRKEKEIRILILGLDNAGKTTILKKLLQQDTTDVSPTLGFNIESVMYGEYKLTFWDVGGQKSLRAYWKNYFQKTDGLIWVVDSTECDSRMRQSGLALQSLLNEEKLATASLLVFANKQDLNKAKSVSVLEKELFDQKSSDALRHIHMEGCCAHNGQGLEEGIGWLVKDIASKMFIF